MKNVQEINEKWLRSVGFFDNPDTAPDWRKEYPSNYKVTLSLIYKPHGMGIWVEMESGGMWMIGTMFEKKDVKEYDFLFHRSPPPTTYDICCLAKGVLMKDIGPKESVYATLKDHGINPVMVKKVLADAHKAYEKDLHMSRREVDPAEQMYWDNVKTLLDGHL